jgi:plasmid stabilization system protein ParE
MGGSESKSESTEKVVFTLEFSHEAETDIQTAYDWYASEKPELADDLINKIDEAIIELLQRPLSFQKLGRGLRKVKTKRFLYGIFYRMEKKVVRVIGVLHLKRNPKIIRARK